MRLEVLDIIVNPFKIVERKEGELLALQEVESKKYLAVVYREFKKDGFIITAFLTRRTKSLMKRKLIWPD